MKYEHDNILWLHEALNGPWILSATDQFAMNKLNVDVKGIHCPSYAKKVSLLSIACDFMQ